MKLYLMSGSGNAYKVRILLSLLKIPYEAVSIDPARGEHRTPEFLVLNPRGEVPVLEDDKVVLWDSAACLVYLARRYGAESWFPAAPESMGEVMQWLALAASEIQFGLQYGRRGLKQNRWTAGDLEHCQAISRVALNALETRLAHHEWLALDRPTIADIACFPYTETAPESAVPLDEYPAVRAWLERCKKLPGWAAR